MFFFGKKEKMFLLKQNIISALIFQLSSVSIIIETNDLKKKKKINIGTNCFNNSFSNFVSGQV